MMRTRCTDGLISATGFMAARPSGHRVELTTRVDGIGDTSSQFHCPANGTNTISIPVIPPNQNVVHDGHLLEPEPDTTHPNTGRLPKFDFPTFEGEAPKLWIVQAEDYFDMYHVPKPIWVRVARMRFRGAAGRWISSLDHPGSSPLARFLPTPPGAISVTC